MKNSSRHFVFIFDIIESSKFMPYFEKDKLGEIVRNNDSMSHQDLSLEADQDLMNDVISIWSSSGSRRLIRI